MSNGKMVQRPQIQAMTLVAVAVVVLAIEPVGARVAEAERIALVVVVGLVDRQRVVRLVLEIGISQSAEAEGDAVVA